jgi:hypothetical protein
VRWTKREGLAIEPADRPLRVMVMATDPEGVEALAMKLKRSYGEENLDYLHQYFVAGDID